MLLKIFDYTEKETIIILASASIVILLIVFLIVKTLLNKKTSFNKEQLKAPVINEKKTTVLENNKTPKTNTITKNEEVLELEKTTISDDETIDVEEEIKEVKKTKTKKEKIEINNSWNEFNSGWNEIEAENTPRDKRYSGKYFIFQEGNLFRYRLKANNGEGLVVSEPYSTLKACQSGIQTLKKNAIDCQFDVVCDKHNLYHFRILTKQGRVLAQSANYKTEKRAHSAIDSFNRFVNATEIVVDNQNNSHFEAEVYDVEINTETMGKYEIMEDNDGFSYVLKASNGRIICQSQPYKSKETCLSAIEKFRVQVYKGSFHIFKDKNNKFQFKLYNQQHRLVMTGEVYNDKQRVISVIESIKRFASYAVIID